MKKLHVGIILDGNRRFAKRLIKQPWKGHEFGITKFRKLLDWAKELEIKELTLYCLSLENFNRSKKEFDYLMKLFEKEANAVKKDSRIHKNKIKLNFIGKTELFPKTLQTKMKQLEALTKSYNNLILNLAIAYGGRQEIVDAVKKLVKSKKPITEKNLQNELWLKNEPDLIIRTGGEKRTSNFLTWQSVYSEWIFLDKLWPEFTKQDLKKSIKEFHLRKRRFGK